VLYFSSSLENRGPLMDDSHNRELFPQDTPAAPLAERMRPKDISEFAGQRHLLGPASLLPRVMASGQPVSLILWGPPGSGKTTLARILARAAVAEFLSFSAVLSGVKEIREVVERARRNTTAGRRTVLFVDEIHRFNKAQQDAFLPHVEAGLITLIGATTENPSFEVISPLLSRLRVVVLEPLAEDDLRGLLERALKDSERGLGALNIEADPEALEHIVAHADGDARRALNGLEAAALTAQPDEGGVRRLTREVAEEAKQRKALLYDKAGEEHYNLISALHKSLRDSDPDASLYWLARMLEAGEDPLYLARRMVRFASEDIGNADPQALQVALAAMESYRFLGSPEGELALAQAALYLACAPKSNAAYTALGRVRREVRDSGALPVPLHLRNAPTGLMKRLGYGAGYRYAHEEPEAQLLQEHLPERLRGKRFYLPTDRGFEKTIRERLAYWARLRKARPGQKEKE
jgi:putative ATPase